MRELPTLAIGDGVIDDTAALRATITLANMQGVGLELYGCSFQCVSDPPPYFRREDRLEIAIRDALGRLGFDAIYVDAVYELADFIGQDRAEFLAEIYGFHINQMYIKPKSPPRRRMRKP